MALRTLSVCAGVGGLDLGVRIARPDARCVAFVEREASAAASLVASMAAGRLHPAAVWSDLRTFDAPAWRGAVDCVLSGDPCQGNSVAGKRLGADDDRWLLDRAIKVFDQSGARAFFRENVVGNVAGQLAVAIPALERLGCRVACGIFSAAEASASHRRERFFLLAHRKGGVGRVRGGCATRPAGHHPDPCGCSGGLVQGSVAHSERQHGGSRADGPCLSRCEGSDGQLGRSGQHMVDAEGFGRREGRTEHVVRGGRDTAAGTGSPLGDADGARLPVGSRGRADIGRPLRDKGPAALPAGGGGLGEGRPRFRHDRPFAPGPSDPVWAEIVRDAPSLEPAVCRVAHGVAGRIERLRHCGNGVVPLTAALAWVRLHGLLADAAAGDAVRFADDRSASAGAAAVRAAA